jgi:hypothetical protein
MVKQADVLLYHKHGRSLSDPPLAVEVAYNDQELEMTRRECLLWKTKGSDHALGRAEVAVNVALTIKIDKRIQAKRSVGWSSTKQATTFDPMITLFVVREVRGSAEKRKWGDGPVKLQYAIGRASGIAINESTRREFTFRSECVSSACRASLTVPEHGTGTRVQSR